MSSVYILLILVAHQAKQVVGYSSGAPFEACTSLSPISGHGVSTATGSPPYNLSLSANTYNPGDVLKVSLSGLNGATFKGFLIVGKQVNVLTMVGSFNASTGMNMMCPGNSGVTHTDNTDKTSVTITWTAPSTPRGDVVFHYAVVRALGSTDPRVARQDYFADIKSATLKANMMSSFKKNTNCGVTRGCLSSCQGNDCVWEATWKDNGTNYEITMTAIAPGDNLYFALGFSENSAMFPASVVACIAFSGQISVNASFNSGHFNTPLHDPKEGIRNEINSHNNGILTCSFSRDSVSGNPSIFNLTQSWYLITAEGSVGTGGAITNHGPQGRFATSTRINLSNSSTDYSVPFIATPTPTSPGTFSTGTPLPTFRKDKGCGKTKGCYSKCSKCNCNFLVSWQSNGNSYNITLRSANPSLMSYIAFGFSDAPKMNPASVLGCRWNGSSVGVVGSNNVDYSNVPLSDPLSGLSNIEGSYVNGILSCSVTRKTISTNSKIRNLTNDWYLIVAIGLASPSGDLYQHAMSDVYVTKSRIHLPDNDDITMVEPDFTLVKVHGCLMVIAWMFVASLGLSIARFCKKMFPDITICQVKLWFAVHRAAMVLVFLTGITAFIIIFIYVDGYSQITGSNFTKAHPILGIIVTSLLFINPFMSLLRCAPDDPKRPIFNWAHRIVGSLAHVLGGVTIAFGLYLPKANLNDTNNGLIIMIIYGSWCIVFFLAMTYIDHLSDSELSKAALAASLQEMPPAGPKSFSITASQKDLGPAGNYGSLNQNKEPPYTHIKKYLMLANIIVLLALTVSLMIVIITGGF